MKLKLKKKNVFIVLIILIILLVEFINPFKIIASNQLRNLNYSEEASKYIIEYGLKNKVLDNEYSEFININVTNKDFDVDNYEYYKLLGYYEDSNDLGLINSLIEKGYTASDIDCILKTGDVSSIKEFLLKDIVSSEIINNFLNFDYAILANLDEYIEYKELNVCEYDDAVVYINLGLDRDFYTNYDDVNEFSYDMLVNKYNKLSSDFVPDELISFPDKYCYNDCASGNSVMIDAFDKMATALYNEKGMNIYANSGYRSYQDQVEIYNRYLKAYGQNYVNNYVSKPGFSEHQTGLCIDIKAGSGNTFANTKESDWLEDNAYKYGFILRYENDTQEITGYKYEAWHYRYVGVDIAKYIYENDMTFEEYCVRFLYDK